MPIYEYQCHQCHHAFDKMQKVHDAPIEVCPLCQAKAVVRLVSAAGFQLKGTGWYVTDFRDKGKKDVKDKVDAETSAEPGASQPAATTVAEASEKKEQSAGGNTTQGEKD